MSSFFATRFQALFLLNIQKLLQVLEVCDNNLSVSRKAKDCPVTRVSVIMGPTTSLILPVTCFASFYCSSVFFEVHKET